MKNVFLLSLWMIISLVLAFSIIGLVLFLPGINSTGYYKNIDGRRSTWSTIGISLLNKTIK